MTRSDLRAAVWAAAFAAQIRAGFDSKTMSPDCMLPHAQERGKQALYYFDQIPDNELPQ